jgi:hypothetical protein
MAAGGGTTVAYALLFRQRTLRAPLRSCAGDCVGNSLVRPDGSIQSQAFFRFFKETRLVPDRPAKEFFRSNALA